MIIDKGEKPHIVTRRHFEGEIRRHFAGTVIAADGTSVCVEGYSFIFDSGQNQFRRKPEKRTSIFDLAESGYVVNLIRPEVDVDALKYVDSDAGNHLTDGGAFSPHVNEFGPYR